MSVKHLDAPLRTGRRLLAQINVNASTAGSCARTAGSGIEKVGVGVVAS